MWSGIQKDGSNLYKCVEQKQDGTYAGEPALEAICTSAWSRSAGAGSIPVGGSTGVWVPRIHTLGINLHRRRRRRQKREEEKP